MAAQIISLRLDDAKVLLEELGDESIEGIPVRVFVVLRRIDISTFFLDDRLHDHSLEPIVFDVLQGTGYQTCGFGRPTGVVSKVLDAFIGC